jgi:hypothetical protein
LAAKKGLTHYRDLMTWLKTDFGLGHGHANAIAQLLVHPEARSVKPDERLARLFTGSKAEWRKAYDGLMTKLGKFGPDVAAAPTNTYISLLRGSKKFGIVQPATAGRLDIGLKLKGVRPTERLEAAGSWNAMVTHRVRITHPKHIDKEVLAWLKQAYDATKI